MRHPLPWLLALTLLGTGSLTACDPFRAVAWRLEDSGPTGSPTIDLRDPSSEEVLAEGEALLLRAIILHPSIRPDLLDRALSIDGELVDAAELSCTTAGVLTWPTTVAAGWTEASLVVTDPTGHTAEATVRWRGNRAPQVAILSPTEGSTLDGTGEVEVQLQVVDLDQQEGQVAELPTRRLQLDQHPADWVEASAEGLETVVVEVSAPGDHRLTLEATDGLTTSTDTVQFRVQ